LLGRFHHFFSWTKRCAIGLAALADGDQGGQKPTCGRLILRMPP
jgi:hypothetical protein